ncbi:hypothetical protein E4P42_13230 [Mycobacterium sp. PS03-16]|uniref:hypothetical protein n=1 Tax=Mycobacterium sp. PS03-16 TaxID=2559611 RepID=UPI00107401A8|nr:hypothetical protein [Mycobacterium sp. PS03-16]TFV58012.1 hypothetical protein E4P42_13230 [Mycobacterium sp. PS03-16]
MTDNMISAATTRPAPRPRATRRPTWRARWTARMCARRLDVALAVGTPAVPGSALAVRAARLTSRREREALARTLCRAVGDARDTTALMTLRVPVHRTNILSARTVIESVVARLRGPDAVEARGVARLCRILEDGTGPMYRFGRGDLAGRLGAALAAM